MEQLGFRIRWNATESPSVQMLEPNSVAQQRPLDAKVTSQHGKKIAKEFKRMHKNAKETTGDRQNDRCPTQI